MSRAETLGTSRHGSRLSNVLGVLLVAVAVIITLALIVGAVMYRPFDIPSGSMIPTLHVGDYLLASRFAYKLGKPRRGDVVIFELPRDRKVDYIKRIIGLPGETVQLKEGRLYIDGVMVPREPVAEVRTQDMFGKMTAVPTYRETLPGGATDTVIEIQGDTGFNDNTDLFTVPPASYFVLGDNRDNSIDSRVGPDEGGVGFVPAANLVARADFIVFSQGQPQLFEPVE